MIDQLVSPFAEFAFMRRALAAGVIVAIAAAPIGVFLLARRMSLTGEALSHGMLPGIALGFLVAGASTTAMAVGALVGGMAIAMLASIFARYTDQREEAGLAVFFTLALAAGVTLLSVGGATVDVSHILFGSILSVDRANLAVIAGAAVMAIIVLALIWPALVLDTADSAFFRSVSGSGPWASAAFMGAVVLILAAAFQAVGTLMSVGMLVLPAATARFVARRLPTLALTAAALGVLGVAIGLLASFYTGAPSGPSIVLTLGAFYAAAFVVGPADGAIARRARATAHAF